MAFLFNKRFAILWQINCSNQPEMKLGPAKLGIFQAFFNFRQSF